MSPGKVRSRRSVPPEVVAQLAYYFGRNGYVRRQNPQRRRNEGHILYKKGDEVRLVADSSEELDDIRRLLKQAGFKRAHAFRKGRQYRQPVYGRFAVRRFLYLVMLADPSAAAIWKGRGRAADEHGPQEYSPPVGHLEHSSGGDTKR